MKTYGDVDLLVSRWLEATAPTREPEHLLDNVLTTVERTNRRPAWRIPERWIPMQTTLRWQPAPRLVPLVLVAFLIAAVLAAIAFVGSQRRLPLPTGPAANGQIAYASDGQLWLAEPDGSNPHAVTSDASLKGVPVWSRDGTRLAFLARPEGQPAAFPSLVAINADGSDRVVIEPAGEAMEYASWSADGREILFSKWITYPGQRDRIFIAASDGSSAPRQVGDPDLSAFFPEMSPDGSRILFVSDHNDRFALHIMGTDGANLAQLTKGEIDPILTTNGTRNFAWNPDGNQISFAGTDGRGRFDLFVIAADGTSPERAIDTSDQPEYDATWSPLGDSIVYLRGRPTESREIVVSRPDGSKKAVVAAAGTWFSPKWSPDGRFIAAGRQMPGGDSIVIIRADGRGSPIEIRTTIDVASDGPYPLAWQRVAP